MPKNRKKPKTGDDCRKAFDCIPVGAITVEPLRRGGATITRRRNKLDVTQTADGRLVTCRFCKRSCLLNGVNAKQ